MKNTRLIWTNLPEDDVKAFRLALSFRTGEDWEWKEELDICDVWLLHKKPTANVLRRYSALEIKPLVAVINKDGEKLKYPFSVKEFGYPDSMANIFKWLDGNLYLRGSTPKKPKKTKKKESKNSIQSPRPNTNLTKPWKVYAFKLKAWPNISKYSNPKAFALTCLNLLKEYYDYSSALQWGLSNKELDLLLSNAHNKNRLLLREKAPSPKQTRRFMSPARGNETLIQKLFSRNVTLLQKLINRFR